MHVGAVLDHQAAGIAGLDHRFFSGGFRAQAVAGGRFAQAHHAAQRPRLRALDGRILRPGIEPDLRRLFRPERFAALVLAGQQVAHFQLPAGDFHEGQPRALGVPGNFIHPGPEGVGVGFLRVEGGEGVQQFCDALVFQRRTEIAGEQPPGTDELLNPVVRHAAFLQIIIQCCFVAQGDFFVVPVGEVHDILRKLRLQVLHQRRGVVFVSVHFVGEEEHGHLKLIQ